MKRIVILTPIDAEFGFKLTGVSHYVTKEEDAESTIRKIIREPDTGLIIIDEQLIKGLAEEKLKEIEKSWHGILVVLPSPERPEVEIEDYAVRLIRRAIGYHVRLRL
jgi:V/A-type H+-transporting ATPase subunit F